MLTVTTTPVTSGTVDTADLVSMEIKRDDAGDLFGVVHFKALIDGAEVARTATWALTPAQKSSIVSNFVASAKAAATASLSA